jgi:hypothetical protein
MLPSKPRAAMLLCHPDTCSGAVHGIKVQADWMATGELALSYTLQGEIGRLKIPSPEPLCRADRLWEHTCFEAFVSFKGESPYYEFNFAPSRAWAAYRFRRYRDGEPLQDKNLVTSLTVYGGADKLDLEALVRLRRLQIIQPKTRMRLALSAVIEEADGRLSYWALKHPPGKPDFHHPDAFALEIERSEVDALNESVLTIRR